MLFVEAQNVKGISETLRRCCTVQVWIKEDDL